ncbi:MAG TPA: gluconokinase [Phototrophicaceae bacterium]|nr:gluconokinase [Phototrophicaceae bacterium]
MTILVLDLGSSSVRALLFDDKANEVAQTVRRHHLTTTPPGAATLDMSEVQSSAEACIDEILQKPEAKDIRAVGADTLVGNLLGVDATGKAVTPIYSYADTRSADDVTELAEQIDLEATHQRTGCVHHTAYHPGRLRWLKRIDPKLYESVRQWTDLGTYLYRQWFSEAPCSYSVASWSGLLNRETLAWDDQWLNMLDLPKEALPKLADYTETCSGLKSDYATRWPALRDAPFFLAVGDGAAANVGSGCAEPGKYALSVGTSSALRTVSTDKLPHVPAGLWSYRIGADLHLLGGAMSEGGSIFEWAKATLKLPEDAEQQLTRREADVHGLTFLPLLSGERSLGWAADAVGTIHGLRQSTTALDLLQAALEGVALRLALISERLGGTSPVIGSGGGLDASPAWRQMIANALNRELQFAGESEITARGVAILVLSALDKTVLSAFPPKITATVTPQPEAVAQLRAARDRQQMLYHKFYTESDTAR